MSTSSTIRNLSIALAISVLCAGCFGSKSSNPDDSSGGGPPPVNQAPTISGTPPTSLAVGQAYDFQPSASDPDGDALTFSIQNRPQWATFSSSSGRLQGTPGAADVGQFTGVTISVSDGRASAALSAFSIAVNQIAVGSATLSWTPPTTNADGTTITDLSGYRIYYGQSSTSLSQTIVISNPGTIRWVVENLSPATWYFAMTSFNVSGNESTRSAVVSRAIS